MGFITMYRLVTLIVFLTLVLTIVLPPTILIIAIKKDKKKKEESMKFEEIKIHVPKGTKEEYKALAEEENISLNNLMLQLLEEHRKRNEVKNDN